MFIVADLVSLTFVTVYINSMVVSAAVRSKLAILLSFSQYLMLLPVHVCLCVGGGGLFCSVVFGVSFLLCMRLFE